MGGENKDAVEISGPGGWKAKIFGRDSLHVILIVVIVYFLWTFNQEHAVMLKEMQTQTWLLSLPPENRPELLMPEGVRERLYQRAR